MIAHSLYASLGKKEGIKSDTASEFTTESLDQNPEPKISGDASDGCSARTPVVKGSDGSDETWHSICVVLLGAVVKKILHEDSGGNARVDVGKREYVPGFLLLKPWAQGGTVPYVTSVLKVTAIQRKSRIPAKVLGHLVYSRCARK